MAMKPSDKLGKKPKPSQTPIFKGKDLNPAPGKTGKQGFVVGQPDPATQKSNEPLTDARKAALMKSLKRK